MILDGVSSIRILSRGGDILILIVFLTLEALEALLTALKIFLIILKASITRIVAFLNLIVVVGIRISIGAILV